MDLESIEEVVILRHLNVALNNEYTFYVLKYTIPYYSLQNLPYLIYFIESFFS